MNAERSVKKETQMKTRRQAPARNFIAPDAAPETLIRAAAINHSAWFRDTTCAVGGEILQTQGVKWTCDAKEATLAFPRLSRANAGDFLDAVVAECRRREVERIGFWTTTPIAPRDLAARLAARGFERGWRPHWMALDLRNARADFPAPPTLEIRLEDAPDWDVTDLPYYSREDLPKMRILTSAKPRRTWQFGAWLDGEIVGQTVLYLTTGGRGGVAGIYNVGVVPAARRQGVGRAVTLAACRFAQSLGCHYALLNSATHIYDRIGFESLRYGQTWWMQKAALEAPAPSAEQIAFVEAIGRGDTKTLDALPASARLTDLDAPLLCGANPMTLAVQTKQVKARDWLAERGATLELLHFWDSGEEAKTAALIREKPELVSRPSGPRRMTPLHEAAFRNDIELARLLLTDHPDLEARDAEYNGTPRNWAQHFDRTEIIALIEAYEKGE